VFFTKLLKASQGGGGGGWGGVWGKVLVDGFVFCFGGERLGSPPCAINSFLKIGFEKKPTIPNPITSAPNDDHVVRNCGFFTFNRSEIHPNNYVGAKLPTFGNSSWGEFQKLTVKSHDS
jgi:hypothetical protein